MADIYYIMRRFSPQREIKLNRLFNFPYNDNEERKFVKSVKTFMMYFPRLDMNEKFITSRRVII